MTGQIMLSPQTSVLIEAAAAEFMKALGAAIQPEGPKDPVEGPSFAASVGVQAVLRGQMSPTDGDLNQALLIGGGEGLGMLLGLIEDPQVRMLMFQHCVQAMHTGCASQAKIHQPAGEA